MEQGLVTVDHIERAVRIAQAVENVSELERDVRPRPGRRYPLPGLSQDLLREIDPGNMSTLDVSSQTSGDRPRSAADIEDPIVRLEVREQKGRFDVGRTSCVGRGSARVV